MGYISGGDHLLYPIHSLWAPGRPSSEKERRAAGGSGECGVPFWRPFFTNSITHVFWDVEKRP